MISVEEARRLVLDAARPCPTTLVPLAEAPGLTLAAPVVSRDTIPPFANSAMDGFAVRMADVATIPARLEILEDIPAGTVPKRVVGPGTCARIMTGAMLPEGADTVVPVEQTTAEGRYVRIERVPKPGQHIRPAGKDVQAGQTVLEAGTVISPPVVGMLATLGVARAEVRMPPRVAIISTGDELVPPEAVPGPGQIRDANGPGLAAQVQHAGGLPRPLLHAADTPASLRACLDAAREADVIVLSGGVSMGTKDLVGTVLRERGFMQRFWKVRQRPGKPLLFGLLGETPVFGLPGNPVSSAVCFEQYVRPLLAAMLGRREVLRPRVPARLDTAIEKAAGAHHFIRATARFSNDGILYVQPTGAQDSNLYSSLLHADGFIHLPETLDSPPAGTVILFEWLRWH